MYAEVAYQAGHHPTERLDALDVAVSAMFDRLAAVTERAEMQTDPLTKLALEKYRQQVERDARKIERMTQSHR